MRVTRHVEDAIIRAHGGITPDIRVAITQTEEHWAAVGDRVKDLAETAFEAAVQAAKSPQVQGEIKAIGVTMLNDIIAALETKYGDDPAAPREPAGAS